MTQEKLQQATELTQQINHLQGQLRLWKECRISQIAMKDARNYAYTADLTLLDLEPIIQLHIYHIGRQLTDLLIKFEQL